MSQKLIVKPQGMITEPNKVGQYPPGAALYALNAAIRSFGLMEQAPKWLETTNFLTGTGLAGGVYAVADGAFTVLVYESPAGQWNATAFRPAPNGTTYVSSGTIPAPYNNDITPDGRTGMLLMRNRLIVTTQYRSFVIDYIFPNNSGGLTSLGPRYCGLYQSGILDRDQNLLATAAEKGTLSNNSHMSAVVVNTAKFTDGYELVGPPSVPFDFANLNATLSEAAMRWYVRRATTTQSSIYVEQTTVDMYRTREQSVGYDSVNNKYIPIANGSSFYKTKQRKSGSLTPNFRQTEIFFDGALPNAFGEQLLTNVAVGGGAALPLPPVPSKTCAVFRGHAFYANRFDPATITLLSPFFWGNIPHTASINYRTYGVGVRTFLGTSAATVNGSPTISTMTTVNGLELGQDIVVYRAGTSTLVLSGEVSSVNQGALTVTASVNANYTGTVDVYAYDIIEINGARFRADLSPQLLAYAMTVYEPIVGYAPDWDITAPALEPVTSSAAAGVYPAFVPTGGLVIRMRTNESLSIRATRGNFYSPELPTFFSPAEEFEGKEQLNGFAWSENNEPENCPPANYQFVGGGEIYKIIATRDCLWFFCSDGLFRLSGNGGSVGDGYDWVIDPVDPSLVIANVNCACVLREYVYAYTNRGLVSISSEGQVRELSDGRVNVSTVPDLEYRIPNADGFREATDNGIVMSPWMAANPREDEVTLSIPLNANQGQMWVYNTKTDTLVARIPSVFPGTRGATFGVWSENYSSIIAVSQNVRHLYSVPTTEGFEEMRVKFQPLYGASPNSAHTMKHWQDVQVSFRTPAPHSGRTVRLDGVGTATAGTRALPQTSYSVDGTPSETSRVGFTIPRAFPAVANTFSCELTVSASPAGVTNPVALEGISVNYIDFTDQRDVR